MYIYLDKRVVDGRMTRVVIGKPSSTDISTIFEDKEVDFLTSELITPENFDSDDIFFITGVGYTKRASLLEYGFIAVECKSLHEAIVESMLLKSI